MSNLITQEEREKIRQVCRYYKLENFTINQDGSVDVDGQVWLYKRGLTELPLRFNKVSGGFYIQSNSLTSLDGCPIEVGGDFLCQENKLTSLEHCPNQIQSNFNCSENKLNTLEWCPEKITGDFRCLHNELTTLKYFPKDIGGDYNGRSNELPFDYEMQYYDIDKDSRNTFIKYMNYYDVWDPKYSYENAKILMDDIKDGLR